MARVDKLEEGCRRANAMTQLRRGGMGGCDKAFSPSTSSPIESRQCRHSSPLLVSGGWTSGHVGGKKAGLAGNKKKEERF